MGKRSSLSYLIGALLIILAVVSGASAIFSVKSPSAVTASLNNVQYRERPTESISLPKVGSQENLKKLLAQINKANPGYYGLGRRMSTYNMLSGDSGGRGVGLEFGGAEEHSLNPNADYSTTNIQVQGVDEADIVKTDGEYIYQTDGRNLFIIKARPAGSMRVAQKISFDKDFTPLELYVDSIYLTVVGQRAAGGRYLVKVLVYDKSDPANPKKVKEIEVEGEYLSSRKIGNDFYLAANNFIYANQPLEATDTIVPVPRYRDSAGPEGYREVNYSNITYFPDAAQPNYLIIAGIKLDRPDQEARIHTFLGAGAEIYASTENLYVAAVDMGIYLPGQWSPANVETDIHKFALFDGEIFYQAKGTVPGRILNQFSMDEHGDHFRIATTLGEVWGGEENLSKNNVYVLNKGLGIIGKIEDIAPGEKIYSVRFIGNRAYMVTFKKVDPFFVIDLADPAAPQILGYLKIPGYSDYLHPYDENHIIGFGKDAVESDQGNFAFFQGMKIAVFDVSDVSRPVEKFKTVIGDRGTDSELLYNHKALLFDRGRNLLAFPVNVYEIKNENKVREGFPPHGEFTFGGAYVYEIDINEGLKLKGKITHSNDSPDGRQQINRIMYIGNTLYTSSFSMIKANGIDDLEEIEKLDLRAD